MCFSREEGQGCCTSQLLPSRVLCHCHPISLGTRGEDSYQSGFIVEVKLSILSNILPNKSRSAIAERGALNRCQHFLHTRARVVLRRDIKRFRRISILECTQVAAGQDYGQPDALSQLVLLSVGVILYLCWGED